MKLGSLAGARPAYYDRNATGGRQRYVGTVSPHAQTARWTVTIASGRKGLFEVLFGFAGTTTLPTAGGLVSIAVDTSDGTTTVNAMYNRFTSSTTSSLYITDRLVTQFTAYAGYTITAQSYDAGTGGTSTFILDGAYTTFDA